LSGENLVGLTRSFRIIKIWSWWIQKSEKIERKI
jgi:hypothetical protein